MVELRIEISDDLKRRMSDLPIDWSVIIASFINKKVSEWREFRTIVSKSRLTEEEFLSCCTSRCCWGFPE